MDNEKRTSPRPRRILYTRQKPGENRPETRKRETSENLTAQPLSDNNHNAGRGKRGLRELSQPVLPVAEHD